MLHVSNLVRHFGTVHAVNGVDFRVERGEVVGLLGPNGAGKTTTLRTIAGILEPTSGGVTLDGVSVHADPLAAKARMGFLSGDTQLYQRLTARGVLQYFGELYQVPRAHLEHRIETLIRELEMEAFCDRPCETLSSGQKQRANIARAFLHEPELLILDEPTSALDVISGHFIVEAIQREQAAGRAVLFSTHIMSEAEYLCDRIVLLHQGTVVDQGALPDLLERSGATHLADIFLAREGRLATAPAPAESGDDAAPDAGDQGDAAPGADEPGPPAPGAGQAPADEASP